MFLFDVARDFDYACKVMIEKNPQLGLPWTFIRDHERRPVVLNNVCKQIMALESRAMKKNKVFDPRARKEVIAAAAQMFVKLAVQQRDQSVLSEADKFLIQEKDKAKREVQEMGILKEVTRGKQTSLKA
jgi:hypothetical protein